MTQRENGDGREANKAAQSHPKRLRHCSKFEASFPTSQFPWEPRPRESVRPVYVSVLRFLLGSATGQSSKPVIDALRLPASSVRATAKIDPGRAVFSRSQVKVRAMTYQ